MKTIRTSLKNAILLTALAILSSNLVFAQKSGVFKTYADYQSGKMEYGINCATESHKIKLNDFLGKDYITVIHDGKPYELKKAETWGYQLCDEKLVRFQEKEHYPLLEKGVLWIYTKESTVSSSHAGATKYVTKYYFSKGGNGSILELTLNNVKGAFPENHKLHDAISEQFKTDASLGEQDTYHKMTNINHFLEMQGLK